MLNYNVLSEGLSSRYGKTTYELDKRVLSLSIRHESNAEELRWKFKDTYCGKANHMNRALDSVAAIGLRELTSFY